MRFIIPVRLDQTHSYCSSTVKPKKQSSNTKPVFGRSNESKKGICVHFFLYFPPDRRFKSKVTTVPQSKWNTGHAESCFEKHSEREFSLLQDDRRCCRKTIPDSIRPGSLNISNLSKTTSDSLLLQDELFCNSAIYCSKQTSAVTGIHETRDLLLLSKSK